MNQFKYQIKTSSEASRLVAPWVRNEFLSCFGSFFNEPDLLNGWKFTMQTYTLSVRSKLTSFLGPESLQKNSPFLKENAPKKSRNPEILAVRIHNSFLSTTPSWDESRVPHLPDFYATCHLGQHTKLDSKNACIYYLYIYISWSWCVSTVIYSYIDRYNIIHVSIITWQRPRDCTHWLRCLKKCKGVCACAIL